MNLLAEQLFLLSIDPKTKRPYGRAASLLSYTLNDALLAELMIKGCLAIKNEKIVVVEETSADPLLKETIDIVKFKPNQTSKQMVATLRRKHQNIQTKLAEKLAKKGDLTLENKGVFGVSLASFYQVEKENYLAQCHDRLLALVEKAKMNQLLENDQSDIVLLSLIYHNHLLKIAFPDKVEAKDAEKTVKEIHANLSVSASIKEIIESINISILSVAGNFIL